MENYSQNALLKEAQNISAKILDKNANELQEYPFKHLIVDQCFSDKLVADAISDFPPLDNEWWEETKDEDIEIKYRSKFDSEFDIPSGILPITRILNSSVILKAISQCFNIPKLVPDSYYSGGGLNVMTKGGLLDVHVDGNYHDATGLNRRINVILYLNKDWKEEYGGHFGLYTDEGETLVKKVLPLYNRLVIFDTHDKSFHGLPDPIRAPEGMTRKSIILYYYTAASRPSELGGDSLPHSALWKKRNGLDKRGNKTRKYE